MSNSDKNLIQRMKLFLWRKYSPAIIQSFEVAYVHQKLFMKWEYQQKTKTKFWNLPLFTESSIYHIQLLKLSRDNLGNYRPDLQAN